MDSRKRVSVIIALVGCALSACDKGDVFDDRTRNNPQVADMPTRQEGGTIVNRISLDPGQTDVTCLNGTVATTCESQACADIKRDPLDCSGSDASANCDVVFRQKVDLSTAKAARIALYAIHDLSGNANQNDDFLNNRTLLQRETRAYIEQLGPGTPNGQLVHTFIGTRAGRYRIISDLPLKIADSQIRLRLRVLCEAGAAAGVASTWKVDSVQVEIDP